MDPVQVKLIATAAMAAGGIIFCGALYAIFYALGRLGGNKRFIQIGFVSYAGLVLCTALLTVALNLRGMWLALSACLLLGYLVAPPFIWRLCAAVHDVEQQPGQAEAAVHE